MQPFGQPYASTPTDRSNASMSWWLIFVIGWVGPLIFMGADKPPYVRQHARNAMNLALSTTIYMVIVGILCLVLIGILLLPVVGIWHLVCMIQGAMKANNGEMYEAPGAIKFLS